MMARASGLSGVTITVNWLPPSLGWALVVQRTFRESKPCSDGEIMIAGLDRVAWEAVESMLRMVSSAVVLGGGDKFFRVRALNVLE